MAAPDRGRGLLRPEGSEASDRVTYVELFFDLVFVFALTQLSSHLVARPTLVGALEGTILILALWWTWVHTTWVTNWLDPSRLPVRSAVFALAAIAFVLSVSIGQAFGERAPVFALAYAALQIGRTVFMVLATRRADPALARVFTRVLVWVVVASVLWVGGSLLPLPAQIAAWGAAIVLEYVGGAIGFATPGLGRSPIETWDVEGTHIAERAALFVLIAIGEGLLATGLAFVSGEATGTAIVAMMLALISAAAAWWVYFDHGEREGSEAIEQSDRPGALARAAYSYVHLAVIGGIVLLSVGDKELLTHPDEPSVAAAAAILGGPALFLVGTALFRRMLGGRWMPSHLVGIGVLVIGGGLLALAVSPLVLGIVSTGVLVAVAASETVVRLREGRRGGG